MADAQEILVQADGDVLLLTEPMKPDFRAGLHTPNNQMELTAAIKALETICLNDKWNKRHVEVFSDSQYVKNGITSWIKKWKVNGWMTANRKPVLNRELWIALDNAYNKLDVEWNWVKGHAGVKYNEICDQLCKMEMGKF